MKKLLFSLCVLISTHFAMAQAPQGFSYQAVARDNTGNPKANTNLVVKFSILNGTPQGSVLYAETHQIQSNAYGLFNLTIGQGQATSGTFFSAIDWSGQKYLKVEIDGQLSSTTPLLSVPYALYADKTNLKAGAGIGVNGNEISNTGDLSNTNELQQLTISGNKLNLSNGGGNVTLPSTGQWRDTTFDYQQIYYDGPVVIGQKGGYVVGSSFVVAQPTSDVNNNLIGVFNRNYGGTATGLLFYGYPDFPQFNSYLRGYSMLYSPNANRGLQFVAANGSLRFHTGGFANESTERLNISLSGNIGVGTSAPAAKLQIASGDIYIQDANRGVIMKSPDGSCWRMTVSNTGLPVFSKITCPN